MDSAKLTSLKGFARYKAAPYTETGFNQVLSASNTGQRKKDNQSSQNWQPTTHFYGTLM